MPRRQSTQAQSELHPDFAHGDGDIILCSKDGKRFRTYKAILRQASAFFLTTLSLPQSPVAGSGDTVESVPLDEDGDTLEGILRMICAREVPVLESLDVIEPLLHAAEKYDMVGPISIIREAVRGNLELDPFRVYALSCRYGWTVLANVASTRTLEFDISDDIVAAKLLTITDAVALNKLLRLHLKRKQSLRKLLESPESPCRAALARCSACSIALSIVIPGMEAILKWKTMDAMERRPLGDTICTPEFFHEAAPSATAETYHCSSCRTSRIPRSGRALGTADVLEGLRGFIRAFPSTIDEVVTEPGETNPEAQPLTNIWEA